MSIAASQGKVNCCSSMRALLLLAIVALCLVKFILQRQSSIWPFCQEFGLVFLSLQRMLLMCFAVWCGTLLFLRLRLHDLPLIGLLLASIAAYFVGYTNSWWVWDAVTILFSVSLGKGARVLLNTDCGSRNVKRRIGSKTRNPKLETRNFLLGLVMLLAVASWCQLDMTDSFYHGPRWMGLWNNPNTYGMLMGTGVALAIGLLPETRSSEVRSGEFFQSLLTPAATNHRFRCGGDDGGGFVV